MANALAAVTCWVVRACPIAYPGRAAWPRGGLPSPQQQTPDSEQNCRNCAPWWRNGRQKTSATAGPGFWLTNLPPQHYFNRINVVPSSLWWRNQRQRLAAPGRREPTIPLLVEMSLGGEVGEEVVE